jgi:hypothetical protein
MAKPDCTIHSTAKVSANTIKLIFFVSICQVNQEEEGKKWFPTHDGEQRYRCETLSTEEKDENLYLTTSVSILGYSNQYFLSIKTGMKYLIYITDIGHNYSWLSCQWNAASCFG